MKERYADGPAELKLFEVGDGVSSLFGSDTVLEYLVIKPKDASEASVQNVLQQLQSRLPQFGTAKVVVGGSSNLETREIALVGLYASDAVSFEAANTRSRIYSITPTIILEGKRGRRVLLRRLNTFTDSMMRRNLIPRKRQQLDSSFWLIS